MSLIYKVLFHAVHKGEIMAYSVEWYIPKRVILITLNDVTIEDVRRTNQRVRELIVEGESPIHSITDVLQMKSVPVDLGLIKQDYPLASPKVGWVIMVGANPVAKFIANIVAKTSGSRLKMVSTFDEALAFLKSQDDSLVSS